MLGSIDRFRKPFHCGYRFSEYKTGGKPLHKYTKIVGRPWPVTNSGREVTIKARKDIKKWY